MKKDGNPSSLDFCDVLTVCTGSLYSALCLMGFSPTPLQTLNKDKRILKRNKLNEFVMLLCGFRTLSLAEYQVKN